MKNQQGKFFKNIFNISIMKTKNSISIILLLIGFLSNAQNNNQVTLEGSWMGKTTTKDASISELILFRFEFKNNSIKGFMDFPDKRLKDVALDKVWSVKDSVLLMQENL